MFLEKSQNKNRNRAFNRFQRERTIKNKKYILEHIFLYDKRFMTDSRIGQLSKGKVHCSCKMCRYAQHYGLEKEKYVNKKKWMDIQIQEYYKNKD